MCSTNENFDVFNSRDEIYLVFAKKKSIFSFYFILFGRFTVNQFVNHASSRKEDKGEFVTEYIMYLDQST